MPRQRKRELTTEDERPSERDVERYLDHLALRRLAVRRRLEDLANVEDCPETDADIKRVLRDAGYGQD